MADTVTWLCQVRESFVPSQSHARTNFPRHSIQEAAAAAAAVMGGEGASSSGGGFRARIDHFLYSGEKKHVVAGIAIFAAIFGVPWYLMTRGIESLPTHKKPQSLVSPTSSCYRDDLYAIWKSRRIHLGGSYSAFLSVVQLSMRGTRVW